ncbi:MAG: FecR family protein [Myxococcales bacterium]|nr:FecR family protein [Myxococcales bacterium]
MSSPSTPPPDLMPLRVAAERPGATAEERWLAQALQALYPEESPPPPSEAGWAALEAEAVRCARRHRRRFLLGELLGSMVPPQRAFRLVAAASLLACLLLARDTDVALWSRQGPERVTVAQTMLSHRGDRPRSLLLLDGAEVSLEHGQLYIEQTSVDRTRLTLHAGAIRLSVPRLTGQRRLAVATSDAEVIVHGTRFDVRKLHDATLVAVHEGLVEVRPLGLGRAPLFVRPGERTTVLGAAAHLAALSRRVQQLVRELRCDDSEGVLRTFVAFAPAGTDLSAALYLQGICAVQRGALGEAIAAFERSAAVSQDRVRADNALARAAQLRASRDAAEGAQAWRQYLLRFPRGLHADLARRHLATRPPGGRP